MRRCIGLVCYMNLIFRFLSFRLMIQAEKKRKAVCGDGSAGRKNLVCGWIILYYAVL